LAARPAGTDALICFKPRSIAMTLVLSALCAVGLVSAGPLLADRGVSSDKEVLVLGTRT
jgi:hypothetical protein